MTLDPIVIEALERSLTDMMRLYERQWSDEPNELIEARKTLAMLARARDEERWRRWQDQRDTKRGGAITTTYDRIDYLRGESP